MKQRANPTMVGAFIVGAVVLAVSVILLFGSGQFFSKKYEYVVYFRGDVGGLRVGAPVKLRGIHVGSVKKMAAFFDREANIFVEVRIEAYGDIIRNEQRVFGDMSFEEAGSFLLDRGLRAQLASESMVTGLLYVKLDYFPHHPPELTGFNPDMLEIPSVPTSFEELEKKINQALDSLDDFPVREIASSLQATLVGLDSLLATIHEAPIVEAVASLHATLQETQILIRDLDQQVEPATARILESTETIVATLETASSLLANLDAVAVENREEIQILVKDFSSAAQSLRALTDYLETKPEAIIFGK